MVSEVEPLAGEGFFVVSGQQLGQRMKRIHPERIHRERIKRMDDNVVAGYPYPATFLFLVESRGTLDQHTNFFRALAQRS